MARRFKRRRARVAWLPTFGVGDGSEIDGARSPGIEGTLLNSSGTTQDVVWDAFPLTYDAGVDPEFFGPGAGLTLRDIMQGNEWGLRRIVGKIFISAQGQGGATPALNPAILAAFGFIVSKASDDGSPSTDFDLVNPLAVESMNDPWIWRRTWMLSPYGGPVVQGGTESYGPGLLGYPTTTSGYGSVADGPHIDSQVNRRIHTEERLMGVIAFRNYAPLQDESIAIPPTRIQYHLDYRLLGTLRASQIGNRGNASR